MDFGLSGLSRAIMFCVLRKRDLTQDSDSWLNEKQGSRLAKQGKVDNDGGSNDKTSAGVERHRCREQ